MGRRIGTLLTALATPILALHFLALSGRSEAPNLWRKNELPSTRVSDVVTTPYVLMAGENDQRPIYPPPFNGVYMSVNKGSTWYRSGLEGKGVTALAYKLKEVYAGTYTTNSTPAGFYKSTDQGSTWQHFGPNHSATTLSVGDGYILMGTASNGLFRSGDSGNTWQQVLGSGFSPGVRALCSLSSKSLAATANNKVFISEDYGQTWREIEDLAGLIVSSLEITEGELLVGTSNNSGLKRSITNGKSWTTETFFEGRTIGKINATKNALFVSASSNTHNTYGIYRRAEGSNKWFDISAGLVNNNGPATAISYLEATPPKLLISQTSFGLFELNIADLFEETGAFLDLPWKYLDFNKESKRIYSFFDHEYPLLATYEKEPAEYSTTTLNFYGLKKPQPEMFYSSHNGIDFTLPFGTEIIAPADGTATYQHSSGGGHAIKIDHHNGVQTWYLHLQGKDLITSDPTVSVDVTKNQRIGRVGMSGNTTGPHLHFSVLKDKNLDGKFTEYPDGLVDPFGWRGKAKDPWEFYQWSTLDSEHRGSRSNYLWTHNQDEKISDLNKSFATMLNTKSLEFDSSPSTALGEIHFRDYLIGYGFGGASLIPLPNLAVEITARDQTGEELPNFETPFRLNFFYGEDLTNTFEESLKIMRLENNSSFTETQFTQDQHEKKLSLVTYLPGVYVVFGSVKDTQKPNTQSQLKGEMKDGIYIGRTQITLVSSDEPNGSGVFEIYFSLNAGADWEKYEDPITFTRDGSYSVTYKSVDKAGNFEDSQVINFELRSEHFIKLLKILNTKFIY